MTLSEGTVINMNRKTFASAALALVMALLLSIPAFAAKATYTMTFTEGIELINPLTGKKPTQNLHRHRRTVHYG